ncbi:ethylene-responsive transcription factor ERF026-like [Dendrobium catenatum]|uniref:Ethylene-responsive transcription factor ERF025 n=1 Tax=Dendrobium catenatum TaxID=906689 RepID=A0A2I0W0T1_9ASPA|nr:ethylene-responsive transcription factor ERF026-like [Dendrobium catenatum]PKU69248.1 Ethylene-responsive transcription factor ERF025 [Dendrobium catenatum]
MANSNPLSKVEIPASNTPPIIPPSYYLGISSRRGKWTSKIYSWRESKTIWLGTYSTPEMAAIAYDVAALAFNEGNAVFNFPYAIRSHPMPKSTSIADIQAAAAAAAEQFGARFDDVDASEVPLKEICEYVDEEELFNMPQVLIEMAEGLMVSPPRLGLLESDEPLEILKDDNLWNFDE